MADRTCTVLVCERLSVSRGWCQMHYMRWRTTGDAEATKKAPRAAWNSVCSVEDCGKKSKSRGYCNQHYRRVLKHGDPAKVTTVRDHDGRCGVAGCERPYVAKGWCSMHWQRVNGTGEAGGVDPVWKFGPETCSVPSCDRPHRCHGYCASHSQTIVFAPRRRAVVDEEVRLEVVAERDEGRCGLCGEPVDWSLKWPDPQSRSLDHILPIARGGRHNYRNVQLAHLGCNVRKRDRITT